MEISGLFKTSFICTKITIKTNNCEIKKMLLNLLVENLETSKNRLVSIIFAEIAKCQKTNAYRQIKRQNL